MKLWNSAIRDALRWAVRPLPLSCSARCSQWSQSLQKAFSGEGLCPLRLAVKLSEETLAERMALIRVRAKSGINGE